MTASDPRQLREQFERDGYVHLPQLFSAQEAKHYRLVMNKLLGLGEDEISNADIDRQTYTEADAVTRHPELWPVIFHEGLLEATRNVLGPDIRYNQHSDIHVNLHGGQLHRDSAYRTFGQGPDYDESRAPYKVVRVAIYLTDYRDSGSALYVVPGTHRHESKLLGTEIAFWNILRRLARKRGLNEAVPHMLITGPLKKIETKPGDVVIFDQRLVHAGGGLQGNPNYPKQSLFLSYAAPNEHAANHRYFYLARSDYEQELPAELQRQLHEAGLLYVPDDQSSAA